MSEDSEEGAAPDAPPLKILHRDDRVLVVNKPSGLLVHRGWANDEVVAVGEARRVAGQFVYPVHRLDRGASGALAFALDAEAARILHEQFESGAVTKRYVALVRGIPPESGEIDHAIPRREDGPRVPSVTRFRRIATFERYSLVEAVPLTGRLHQVRRHLKHLSCPIIGDANYGKSEHNRLLRERFGLARLALHAVSLSFATPGATSVTVTVRAPLPADLAGPLAAMGLPITLESLLDGVTL